MTGGANPVVPGFFPDPSVCRVGLEFGGAAAFHRSDHEAVQPITA